MQGKTIGIRVDDMYQDHEFWYPCFRMREAGAEVRVISRQGRHASEHGVPAPERDVTPGDTGVADLDGLIIPGGYAPDYTRRDPEILRLVRGMDGQEKLVAAICHAGWVLISAGIAEGRVRPGPRAPGASRSAATVRRIGRGSPGPSAARRRPRGRPL